MPEKMTETTRVPMTLREQFLEDPFFNSSWNDMDKYRNQFFKESHDTMKRFEESSQRRETNKSSFDDSPMTSNWLLPRKWMMPKLFDEKFPSFDMNDSNLISMKDEENKMELSLNTAGYKPDELKVQVKEGVLKVEGKHEEKTEDGHVMVSRQFSRSYGLPTGAKREEVVSNLSQDGVMVITIPKEKKIQELKDSRDINDTNSIFNTPKPSDELPKSYTSTRKESVERTEKKEETRKSEGMVPMTMRDHFFEDPFFHTTLGEIGKSRQDFFKNARESFEKSMKNMESNMIDTKAFFDNTPKDSNLIRLVDDEHKLEISLDTVGYKPDELKVTVGKGVINVEGKHEEKSEAGQIMVSRHFSRTYSLPTGSNPEEVMSNLSQDGVMVISVPKVKPAIQDSRRNVPISVK